MTSKELNIGKIYVPPSPPEDRNTFVILKKLSNYVFTELVENNVATWTDSRHLF